MSLYSQFATEQHKVEFLAERPNIITDLDDVSVILGRDKEYCGAQVATVVKTIYTYPSSGILSFLSISSVDATARDLTATVYIDDAYNAAATVDFSTTAAGSGIVFVGAYNSTMGILTFEPLNFRSLLRVDLTSSLSETNKVEIVAHVTTTTNAF
jgi:hypothetical protein